MKVMENLEKTESNLVISLMALAIKRKERKVQIKKNKNTEKPYKTSFDIWPFVWLSLSSFHF